MESSQIELALTRLGEYLSSQDESYTIVIIGGAVVNLLGFVSRATRDVDVLAVGGPLEIAEPPQPLPIVLADGIREVARYTGLPADWLNTGPALQWKQGLPSGLATRIHWRTYAALTVGLVDRYDLIFFKLYAAADHVGRSNVHYSDLLALKPTQAELAEASEWVQSQDPSEGFAQLLTSVLDATQRDLFS